VVEPSNQEEIAMTRALIKKPVSSMHGVRLGVFGTLLAILAALLLWGLGNPAVAQAPLPRLEARIERIVSLDAALLETIRIEGQIRSWTMRKLCIDGQAYWIGFNETNPTGISPAFKNGKAEQCSPREK
jgi:hypothetical protein